MKLLPATATRITDHGDEIVATYTDDALYTTMRLMKNWLWKSGPIDLSRGEREFYYPFDSYADPKIGILTAFHNFHEAENDDRREELAEIPERGPVVVATAVLAAGCGPTTPELDDPADTVVALQVQAHIAEDRGDLALAERLSRQSLALAEPLGLNTMALSGYMLA